MSGDLTQYRYQTPAQGHSHSYILPVLLKMLGEPDGPVLDLGCGAGWIAGELIRRDYEVYGVDASESGISLAQSIKPNTFFLMDVENQELPAELGLRPFKTIISTEVIEHLYAPRSLLRLVRNVLQKNGGGRFIVSTPYHGYAKNLALALTGKIDAHHTVLWDGGHIKFFSRRTLEKMLEEEDFSVTGFAGAGRIPLLWKSMLVTARVGGLEG